MGLAAWVRAVALPLSALAFRLLAGARAQKLHRAALLTAAGVGRDADRAAALGHPARAPERRALLHRRSRRHHRADRRQPELGRDVHARAQPHVQGRHRASSVLDEPHHETDRAAYAIAREWFRFEPRLRARPRDAEGRSPVRSRAPPALLVDLPARRAGRPAGRLVRRAPRRDRALRGRVRPRRWPGWRWPVSPPPSRAGAGACSRWFRSSSRYVATYATFFAEPRYRLPIELLAFPFVALALGEIVAAARAAVATVARRASCTRRRRSRRRWCSSSSGASPGRRCSTPGRALRARHRWAVSEAAWTGAAACCSGRRRRRSRRSRRWRDRPKGVHVRADGDGASCGAAPAPRRRTAAGRAATRFTFGWSGVRRRALRPRGQDGGGRGRRSRGVRRRNRPSGWTADAVRRN